MAAILTLTVLQGSEEYDIERGQPLPTDLQKRGLRTGKGEPWIVLAIYPACVSYDGRNFGGINLRLGKGSGETQEFRTVSISKLLPQTEQLIED